MYGFRKFHKRGTELAQWVKRWLCKYKDMKSLVLIESGARVDVCNPSETLS